MKVFLAIVLVVASIVGGIIGSVLYSSDVSFTGVTVGNEYNATTTADFAGVAVDKVIKVGNGSLGSIVLTKSDDLQFRLFDATSTQALDAEGFNTSTALLAEFPAGIAVGTYTFDVNFNRGLVLDVVSGTNGTSTIGFR